MAGTPQYVDISVFNPADIDWKAYRAWAAGWDSIARVAIRSSYGVGYSDLHFATYRQGALSAGIDVIIFYHYAYPQFNQATSEADWQNQSVGSIRESDVIMLDYEEGASQANAEWAYQWLARQEQNYGGKLPTIYASDAYIRQRLQDARVARYPLTLANWQFSPTEQPPCPPPWSIYTYLQYTDRATNIPGIAGTVDADIYLGGITPRGEPTPPGLPTGAYDDGTVLHFPNNHTMRMGFRDKYLALCQAGLVPSDDQPLEEEHGSQPVEQSNPDWWKFPGNEQGKGTSQVTRYFRLGWSQERGVVVTWIGQELLWYQQALQQRSQ